MMTSLGKPSHSWFQLDAAIKFIYPESDRTFTLPRRSQHPLTHTIDWILAKTGLNYVIGKLIMRRMIFNRLELLTSAMPRDVDVNVATHCFTAFAVAKSGCGNLFYYIQHYEPLFFEWNPYLAELAESTYSLPLTLITVSSWIRELLKNKYSRDCHLCLNGVDRQIFYRRETTRQNRIFRIMCLGRNTKWKGMSDLTKALNLSYDEFPTFELTVVSQDPISIKNAHFPYKIIPADTDAELAAEYSKSDIFVNASWYEGFSLPTLEAMSCGIPVVTTSLGPEDYAIDGKNALIVPPRKPETMASAIIRLMKDEILRRSLSQSAVATAAMLTWDRSADELEHIFTSCAV